MGRTTAAVPTGASMGVADSATNWIIPMAFGEQVGPIKASTVSSLISFLKAITVWVGSLTSSKEIYSTLRSPILVGKSGTVFFWGMPTMAVGPVAEVTTPIFTCAAAGMAPDNRNKAAEHANILKDMEGSPRPLTGAKKGGSAVIALDGFYRFPGTDFELSARKMLI